MHSKKSTICESDVVQYLISHPGIFQDNPDLFKKLNLYHQDSTGISLLEHQNDLWRASATKTQRYLEDIIENVKANQILAEGVLRFSASLQSVVTFTELAMVIPVQLRANLPVRHAQLAFFPNTLLDLSIDIENSVVLLDENQQRPFLQLLAENNPITGAYSSTAVEVLFPKTSSAIHSLALVPLIHGATQSVLALGSEDTETFDEHKGTEFLSYLKETITSAYERFGE